MSNSSRNVRWRKDAYSNVVQIYDVRRYRDGNEDLHFYNAWNMAIIEATSVSTQRSVTSAVVVPIEMVDNRDEESRKDKQLLVAEQIVLDNVRQPQPAIVRNTGKSTHPKRQLKHPDRDIAPKFTLPSRQYGRGYCRISYVPSKSQRGCPAA